MHFKLPYPLLRFIYNRAAKSQRAQSFGTSLSLDYSEEEWAVLNRLSTLREELKSSEQQISFKDFGKSISSELDPQAFIKEKSISEIYGTASIPEVWAEFLFRLVRWAKPNLVLELGTNIGVGSLYLQSALDLNKTGKLVSLEGADKLANFASELLAHHCDGDVILERGPFSRSLPKVLENHSSFDLVFIDGHHTEEASYRYFQLIKGSLSDKAIVIFDDVEPWSEVKKAWNRVASTNQQMSPVYMIKKGILFNSAT